MFDFFQKAEPNVLVAFIQLGMTVHPPEEVKCWSLRIHVFLFSPESGEQNVTRLRWQMYKKNHSASEKMSPTREAL